MIEPIGFIQSPYKEKFGIPRQSGGTAKGRICFCSPGSGLKGLKGISHLWVIFGFHQINEVKTVVRPPRAGGQQKVGVWATRSPHRPNHLGLSLCRVVELGDDYIDVEGVDILDGSPVYDVKPWVPEDAPKGCVNLGWIDTLREQEIQLEGLEGVPKEILPALVDSLRGDPRPASQRGKKTKFGVQIGDYDVGFNVISEAKFKVVSVKALKGRR